MKKRSARSKYHSSSAKNKIGSKRKKKRTFKGGMGAGTLYAVVALLIIAFGAASMVGNIIPLSSKSPDSGQPVIVSPHQAEAEKKNLQLGTFPGVTLTATPEPTTPPQPQQQWSEGSKEKAKGKGPGNSAPVKGKGSDGNQNSGGIAR